MQAAADLAKTKGLSIVSGMQSRFNTGYQETVKRIHDGEIGNVVAIQACSCAGRTRQSAAPPSFPRCKTSSTIVITSAGFRATTSPSRWCITLTAKLDYKEEMPVSCFGLAGRSASFGEVYGDMYDHHTVVYEYASGPDLCPLPDAKRLYGNSSDFILGSRGKIPFNAYGNNPYDAEQKGPRRFRPQRQAYQ